MQVQSVQHTQAPKQRNAGLEKGELVPMRDPSGNTVLKSLSVVGHAMKAGSVILDKNGNPVPLTRERIHRPYRAAVERVNVFDPGDGYKVCFDPKAPPPDALVYKA